MSRCAIYARFSTDLQNPRSAEDQARICRDRAEREGWTVVDVYSDLAISGSDNRRPGLTKLLSDAEAGSFDIVLAEDLDRVSRDQEDIARYFKRLRFHGIRLVTLADGDVDEMHIGFKGTMNAMELRKLADKIRRGQKGAVDRGRVPGGLCYGYDTAPQLRADGSVERGLRVINEDQAAIVRRIYAEFIQGRSIKAIAQDLNRDGIPSPRGGEWRQTAIKGNPQRAIGVLRNPIYVGELVYNRVRMLKNPETRNRISRTNDIADRVVRPMPELAIVDRETWDAAQARLNRAAALPLTERARNRPRRLLSGLVRCGVCGGSYTVVGTERWGCSRHREAGTCPNGNRVGTRELEDRVLEGLKAKLLSDEAVSLMVRRFHEKRERDLQKTARSRDTAERRLQTTEAAIGRLVDAIAAGGMRFAEIEAKLTSLREEKDRLAAELNEMDAVPVIALHPQIAEIYRARIAALKLDLGNNGADESAAQQIRALLERINLTPRQGGGVEIEVLGSLQAVLDLANDKKPAPRGALRMIPVVAEERDHQKQPERLFRA
jgi:site-specific DNA recombinase